MNFRVNYFMRKFSINEKNPTTNYLLALANQGIAILKKQFYIQKSIKYDKNFT